MSWPWSELGLPGPAGLPEVRRAYAQRLKQTHPEEDPEGFQRLHDAYQQARRLAKEGPASPERYPGILRSMEKIIPFPMPPDVTWEPEPESEEPEEEEWDFSAVEHTAAGPRPPEPEPKSEEPEEEEWDFSAVEHAGPQSQESASAPKPEEETWDYERLFAEREEQQAQERRRQAQERRERYHTKPSSASPEELRQAEEQWQETEEALHILEVLFRRGAPLSEWMQFLHSRMFFAVKWDDDFIAGLTDFLRRCPALDERVKKAISQAYGWYRCQPNQLYRELQEELDGFEYWPREQSRRPAGALRSPQKRTRLLRAVMIVLALAIAGPILLHQLWEAREASNLQRQQALLCTYMAEDFGRPMEPRGGKRQELVQLYGPVDDPELEFQAWLEGERNLAEHKRGYDTNYSEVMMTQALGQFAQEWGYELLCQETEGTPGLLGVYGGSPGGYVLCLPLTGAEDGIRALGELFHKLEEEDWYQAFPPEYEMRMAYQKLSYFSYLSTEARFEPEYFLEYYENELGCAVCAYLVDKVGLGETDFGETPYELIPKGTDGQMFRVSGVDAATGETVREYLFNGSNLFDLSVQQYREGMSLSELMRIGLSRIERDAPVQLLIYRS